MRSGGTLVTPIETAALWSAGFAAGFGLLYAIGRRHDARMLRNGVFLVMAMMCAALALLLGLASFLPVVAILVTLIVAALVPIAILVLAVALIINGIQMLRLEGRGLAHLLSLVAGVAILLLPALIAAVLAASDGNEVLTAKDTVLTAVGLLLFLVPSYFALSFAAFAAYSVVYSKTRHALVPDTIVVLGSGLVRGEVPPLLRSRLDRALAAYAQERSASRVPLLIPSGGQGPDEPRAEAAAMAEYLVAHGVDAQHVIPEAMSRNTRQNLEFSRAVQLAAGRDGQMMVVTNDYHVLRAAVLARRLDLPAQVVGSPTARYYVPSAFLREFVAVTVEHRWLNAIACAPLVVLSLYPLLNLWQWLT
ncbi:YdcF family protein [Clavibacter michiganensis]|uniref:YdcF family protein n=1 Tax=Clavibacter michiganensis TaxID=28447 RepID=UPI000CE7C2FD|nr:YdcF family protein [Clavibacter michiganensis]PPF91338.1 YdcF family protein [Clavibacter michiganensis]PPF99380.1 YdcF family protein [Clavibacter michiganensis]